MRPSVHLELDLSAFRKLITDGDQWTSEDLEHAGIYGYSGDRTHVCGITLFMTAFYDNPAVLRYMVDRNGKQYMLKAINDMMDYAHKAIVRAGYTLTQGSCSWHYVWAHGTRALKTLGVHRDRHADYHWQKK